MSTRMTPKKTAFADAYIGEARQRPAHAARIAGYADAHRTGAKLVRNARNGKDPALFRYLASLADEMGVKLELGHRRKEWSEQARAKAQAPSAADADGGPMKADEALRLLAALARDDRTAPGTALRAIETILKHLGKDKPEEKQGPKMTEDERADEIASLLGLERGALDVPSE